MGKIWLPFNLFNFSFNQIAGRFLSRRSLKMSKPNVFAAVDLRHKWVGLSEFEPIKISRPFDWIKKLPCVEEKPTAVIIALALKLEDYSLLPL